MVNELFEVQVPYVYHPVVVLVVGRISRPLPVLLLRRRSTRTNVLRIISDKCWVSRHQMSSGAVTFGSVGPVDFLYRVTRRDTSGTEVTLAGTPLLTNSARIALLTRAVREMSAVMDILNDLDVRLREEPLANLFEESDGEREERDSLSGSDHGDVHDFEGNLDN